MAEKDDIQKLLDDPARMRAAMELIRVLIDDIGGANDRSAAITACAFLDTGLAAAIASRFIPLSNTIRGDLFSEIGPLSSLRSKINIGYALGLYGKQTRADLHLARRVRNRFAHNWLISKFANPTISDLCQQLQTPKLPILPAEFQKFAEESPRNAYIGTVMLLGNAMEEYAKLESRIDLINSDYP